MSFFKFFGEFAIFNMICDWFSGRSHSRGAHSSATFHEASRLSDELDHRRAELDRLEDDLDDLLDDMDY